MNRDENVKVNVCEFSVVALLICFACTFALVRVESVMRVEEKDGGVYYTYTNLQCAE